MTKNNQRNTSLRYIHMFDNNNLNKHQELEWEWKENYLNLFQSLNNGALEHLEDLEYL